MSGNVPSVYYCTVGIYKILSHLKIENPHFCGLKTIPFNFLAMPAIALPVYCTGTLYFILLSELADISPSSPFPHFATIPWGQLAKKIPSAFLSSPTIVVQYEYVVVVALLANFPGIIGGS